MTRKERSSPRIDLPRLLTVQVAGFVLCHLNQEIIFNATFQRATLDKVWIGNAIATFGSWTWLFGPGIIFLWWAFRADKNRPLALGFAGVTFYCAYYLQYPVLTSFLYQLGQIKRFPLWMMDKFTMVTYVDMAFSRYLYLQGSCQILKPRCS